MMMTLTKAQSVVAGLLPDAMMLAGIAAMAYGASLIYAPAGWIIAGAASLGFGLLLARRGGS